MSEATYEEMATRALADPTYRDGMLAAARICQAQGPTPMLTPCPSEMAAVYIRRVANGEMP